MRRENFSCGLLACCLMATQLLFGCKPLTINDYTIPVTLTSYPGIYQKNGLYCFANSGTESGGGAYSKSHLCTDQITPPELTPDWKKTSIPMRRFSFRVPSSATFSFGNINPTVDIYPFANTEEPRMALFIDDSCTTRARCGRYLAGATRFGNITNIGNSDGTKLISSLIELRTKMFFEHRIAQKDNVERHIFYIMTPTDTTTIQLSPDNPTQEQVETAWRIITSAELRVFDEKIFEHEQKDLSQNREMYAPSLPDSWSYMTMDELPFSMRIPAKLQLQPSLNRIEKKDLLDPIFTIDAKIEGNYDVRVTEDALHPLIEANDPQIARFKLYILTFKGTPRSLVQALCDGRAIVYDSTKNSFRVSRCDKRFIVITDSSAFMFDTNNSSDNFTPFFDAAIKSVQR